MAVCDSLRAGSPVLILGLSVGVSKERIILASAEEVAEFRQTLIKGVRLLLALTCAILAPGISLFDSTSSFCSEQEKNWQIRTDYVFFSLNMT